MTCTTCHGAGKVRLPRKEQLPGAVLYRRRHERKAMCPGCLGTGDTRR